MKREWQSLPVSEGILDLVCSAVEMACCGGPSQHWMLYQRYDLVARAKPKKIQKLTYGHFLS